MSPMTKKIQRNPKVWIAALVATTIVGLGYKLYEYSQKDEYIEETKRIVDGNVVITKKYTTDNIVLTLSHSILSLKLPLNDILINSDNVTFILPPNLNEDDLTLNLDVGLLMKNYKLLKCSNIQGYFNLLKNLKPDLLLVCQDDMGLDNEMIPKDLSRFIKKVVRLDQKEDDIATKLSPLFVN